MSAKPCVIVVGAHGKCARDVQKLHELCRALYQASLIFLVEKVPSGDGEVAGDVWRTSLAVENLDAELNAVCRCLASDDWQDPDRPLSLTYRRLQALCADLHHGWQRDLATLAFALVAHISVNAHLSPFAEDPGISPRNRHDAHTQGKRLAEVAKVMYRNLDAEKQRFFARTLPKALRAFVAEDHSMRKAILTMAKGLHAVTVISSVEPLPPGLI